MKLDELLRNIRFLFLDFDQTVAQTFFHMPGAKNDMVTEAYEMALGMIWGNDSFELLEGVRGLQNRAPGELIRAILENEEKMGDSEGRLYLIKTAKQKFADVYLSGKKLNDILASCVPAGKGISWEWDDENPERIITEFLVRAKLNHLLQKIGPYWPLPCPGFPQFYRKLPVLEQKHGVKIVLGVISSGHEIFIKKTFSCWGIECPASLLTDDDLRGSDIDLAKAAKPNPILLDMLYKIWLKNQGLVLTDDQFLAFKEEARAKTVYFGDDPNKDGQFARNAGVKFGHHDPKFDPDLQNSQPSAEKIIFYDWRQVSGLLGMD